MGGSNHIMIIGAGLCGTLLTLRMAQRGFKVSLFEKLSDMRKVQMSAGRSINLALSNRGLQALRLVGIEEEILSICLPMHGRMIHALQGDERFSRYSGRPSDHINSVSRGDLNIALLNAAEDFDNVSIYFDSLCQSVDLENGKAKFLDLDSSESFTAEADIVIGTDGAGSALRASMMAVSPKLLFNYSQDFLRHGYKELSIPPHLNGGFRLQSDSLHIWPRGDFMVIALPNLDGSFTVTMFHPFDGPAGFNTLADVKSLESFFETQYPDLIELMPDYRQEYFRNPTGTLGTIKCYPWQSSGRCLIMGDAAHAVVPFYGQGMNASFEDVFVFDEIMDESTQDWNIIFQTFQNRRVANTNAIADLALDNFYEMRDHVANPLFIKKRDIELALEKKFPDYYSKYSLVSFRQEISYFDAMNLGRRQDELLLEICARPQDVDLEEIHHQLLKL